MKELERIPVIYLNRDRIQIIVHGNKSSYAAELKHQLTLFQQKARSFIEKRILNDMLERALDNSLRKYPEDVSMSEEMMNYLWAETEKEIIPWIMNRIGNRKL